MIVAGLLVVPACTAAAITGTQAHGGAAAGSVCLLHCRRAQLLQSQA